MKSSPFRARGRKRESTKKSLLWLLSAEIQFDFSESKARQHEQPNSVQKAKTPRFMCDNILRLAFDSRERDIQIKAKTIRVFNK